MKKIIPQNFTYMQVLQKSGASLTIKEMSNCYANTGFALFYAKSGNMDHSSVVAFHKRLKTHGLGFPYEIVVKLLSC